MKVLVTGGAGYIGSHTCLVLRSFGIDIEVLDNFSNSKYEALSRVMMLSGKKFPVHSVNLADEASLDKVFLHGGFDAVIHFAGLKAVGESVQQPLMYYENNITGTLSLCKAMNKHGVHQMVFSSSATVYGQQGRVPLREDQPLAPTNPYGRTKLMLEKILEDQCIADQDWSVTILRYFNPVGAHESGRIGEDPVGVPSNLFPYITQVATGKLPWLMIYGNDYPTHDGTCIRDYIHVMDLAQGHLKALKYTTETTGVNAFNLGTGHGSSVCQVICEFEQASGIRIPTRIGPRRPGDIAVSYADVSKAQTVLGWSPQCSLKEMCKDAWTWQVHNPNGYEPK